MLYALSSLLRRESITTTGIHSHLSNLLKVLASPFSQTCNSHYTSLLSLVRRMHVPGINTNVSFLNTLLIWSKRSSLTLLYLCKRWRGMVIMSRYRHTLIWIGAETLYQAPIRLLIFPTATASPYLIWTALNIDDSAQILSTFTKFCSVWLR